MESILILENVGRMVLISEIIIVSCDFLYLHMDYMKHYI